VIFAVVAGLVVVAVVSVLLFTPKSKQTAAVRLSKASSTSLEEIVSGSGTFQSKRSTVVMSQASGKVEKILVKPGDAIAKGGVIALLNEKEARTALLSAEISVEETRRGLARQLADARSAHRRAQLALDQAGRAADNAASLKAVDGVTEETLRQSAEDLAQAKNAASDSAEALRSLEGLDPGDALVLGAERDEEFIKRSPSYKRALISRDSAQRGLDGCVIRADEGGTVIEVPIAVGNALLQGTLVARIEDLQAIVADVNVDEVDVGKIKAGMSADISADSLLGKTLKGSITRIWPVVRTDSNGRVCRVQLDVALSGNKALSGASCMARITSRLRDKALIIPAAALIPGASPQAVWLLKPEAGAVSPAPTVSPGLPEKGAPQLFRASRREIEIGASTASQLEILSGLSEGDSVAVDNLQILSEGMAVQERAK
jgi:multidrug efflux pump subunit AcrA (membrane-fusion protein)